VEEKLYKMARENSEGHLNARFGTATERGTKRKRLLNIVRVNDFVIGEVLKLGGSMGKERIYKSKMEWDPSYMSSKWVLKDSPKGEYLIKKNRRMRR